MRMTDRALLQRLEQLEAISGHNRKRAEEIASINMTDFIADVYVPLHEDIAAGCHEFYNLPGGRGSGKSSFVSLELVNGIMQDKTGSSNAIVVRKYATTLRGSVIPQLQWAIDRLGVSSRWTATVSPPQFRYETGQVIRLTGLDNPEKLKSLKPSKGYFKYLWIEEFSEINGEPELRNLQQSVLRGGDRFCVFRSFNPPVSKSNWANSFVEIPDDRAVTLLTDYRSIPVEWLGQSFFDEAERLKEINPKAYENEYLGIAVGSGGAVFPNVEVREITDEEINLQEYTFCGLDFGFSVDPACFLRVSYSHKTDTIIIMDEIYKRGLSNKQLADEIRANGFISSQRLYSNNMFFEGEYIRQQEIIADAADPKSIADLRSLGLKVRACHKEPGCVEYRVKWLQHRKIVVDPKRTPNAHRELVNYEYNQDRSGNFLPSLPDKDNHAIDSLAYALDREIYIKGRKSGVTA